MRVVVAPDKYAGTLSAAEVAAAIERGWLRRAPGDEVVPIPVADGGYGLVAALRAKGETRTAAVEDPLGRRVDAEWLLLDGGRTAVVEAAQASGLHLLAPGERDPLVTTSSGTGDLLCAALGSGATRVVVGVGGTGTNDGGAGLAQALGAWLLDAAGHPLVPGGAALAGLDRVELADVDPRLGTVAVVAAVDVDSPLYGPDGASATYGPQKGADTAAVALLDGALRRYAEVLARDVPGAAGVADRPGAGAGGGLGAGLMAFCGATVRPGAAYVLDLLGAAKEVARADLVVTGEGSLDGQSFRGKATAGVAALAQREGVPCLALCGQVSAGRQQLAAAGFDAAYATADVAGSADEARADAALWLEELAAQVAGEWSRR